MQNKELESKKLGLLVKAMKQFPNSPRQLDTRTKIMTIENSITRNLDSNWISKYTSTEHVMEHGVWKSLPDHLQRVIVRYTNGEISDMVWFGGKKFRNKYGIELFNITDWKPYFNENGVIEYHEEKLSHA